MNASPVRLNERRERVRDEEGFSLIELLVIIVVLGILAAIVVFAVQSLTQQSSNGGCQSDFKTVEVAAESYKAQMGAYPADVTNMLSTAASPTLHETAGPWLKDVPGSSMYSVVVGTANLPVSAVTVATAAWGAGATPALQVPDGVIWIGTPSGVPTTYTSGSGATLTNNAGSWAAAGNIYQYSGPTHATSTVTGELTATAQAPCRRV